jgi:hypothetical protein
MRRREIVPVHHELRELFNRPDVIAFEHPRATRRRVVDVGVFVVAAPDADVTPGVGASTDFPEAIPLALIWPGCVQVTHGSALVAPRLDDPAGDYTPGGPLRRRLRI